MTALANKTKEERISQFFDGLMMYLATAFGVLLSRYMPTFKMILAGVQIKSVPLPYVMEVIAAFAVGIIVVYMLDDSGGDQTGKRKNFSRRFLYHIAMGSFWHTVIK